MADFEHLFNEVKDKVVQLGKESLGEFASQATKEVTEYLQSVAEKLKLHTMQLATGKIDKDDFELILNSEAALGQMKIQTQIGLAKIRADKFMAGVKSIVLETLLKVVGTVL